MKLSVRREGSVLVFDMSGKLGEYAAEILRQAVDRVLKENKKLILLNLARVSYMDSPGIGELVACYKRTREKKGILKLLNPSGKVYDLLQLTKLEEVFESFRDEREAIRSFSEKRLLLVEECPICKWSDPWPLSGTTATCPGCASRFHVEGPADEWIRTIRSVELPTYPGEHVRLTQRSWFDNAATISIDGRIDLFAFDMIKKAYLSLPSPRRVIIEIEARNSITPESIRALLALRAPEEAEESVVISDPSGVLGRRSGVLQSHWWEAASSLPKAPAGQRMTLHIKLEILETDGS